LPLQKSKEPPNIGKNSILKIVMNLEPILAKTKMMMGEFYLSLEEVFHEVLLQHPSRIVI
jgi:hypothetical protein